MTWWKNHLDVQKEGLSVGFCGAGGKTTCLWKLSEELIKNHKKVLITTTTKMYPYKSLEDDQIVIRETFNPELFKTMNRVQWFSKLDSEGKGCSPEVFEIEEMHKNTNIWKLIEIDGSRRRPIKAPRPLEPVFEKNMDLVFGLISLEVLGKPANEAHVQHVEAFLQVTGLAKDAPISLEAISKLIESPEGLFAHKPEKTRAVVLLNQVRQEHLADVKALRRMVSMPVEVCFWEEEDTQMAILVLAAGQSQRMGRDKLFLPLSRGGRKTHCLENTLEAVERYAEESRLMCSLLCVYSSLQAEVYIDKRNLSQLKKWQKIQNKNPEMGQSSSLVLGIREAIRQGADVICFVAADQPNLTAAVFHQLEAGLWGWQNSTLERRSFHDGSVPTVLGQWRNPLMLRRPYFESLLDLQGDQGAKKTIQKMALAMAEVTFETDSFFIDMDTPEAYEQLKEESHFNLGG